MTRPSLIRIFALITAVALSATAGWLFIGFTEFGGLNALDVLRAMLIVISGFWLVWGSAAGLMGLFVPKRKLDFDPRQLPQGMTAILVPIYNEDPVMTFSRIAAMNRSLKSRSGSPKNSTSPSCRTPPRSKWPPRKPSGSSNCCASPAAPAASSIAAAKRISARRPAISRISSSRSGGAYDYALILDADSLMEGATIGEMARRMDADAELGLLQTVPEIINARSFFGRSMQFPSAYLSPIFARGAALMQGNEGPYWGHNAIVRVSAFAANCGLPVLSGPPPHGGHILSHDYVEAALLSRAGWKVNLDPDLQGSYEEGPENLIEYAKRDRRWCQGNLQHRRLILAPRPALLEPLHFRSGHLRLSGLAPVAAAAHRQHCLGHDPGAALSSSKISDEGILGLAIGVALILVLPKVLILVRGMLDGNNQRFGGTLRAAASRCSPKSASRRFLRRSC